ncbi:MAG: PBP1A family penicillin-binding protein [Pseudomonadota bacterium]
MATGTEKGKTKGLAGRFPLKLFFSAFVVIPLVILVEVPVFLAGALLGSLAVYSRDLPEIPELNRYQPRTVSTFYADDGTVIGVFYKEKRFVADLEQMPQHLINAFLAAEDNRFFVHPGVDWLGILRAVGSNLKNRKLGQGGSTITMQVARNFLLGTQKKTFSRKIKEMILAVRLEKVWGKKKILYVYLNEIYLGDGCYGIEAASRNYFDKPMEHLTVSESALIAGLVASPSRYNPFKSEELARNRKNTVLGRMLRFGYVDQSQHDEAKNRQMEFRRSSVRPFDLVPDFAEAVRRYVMERYGADKLYNEGLKVFTTCKTDFQRHAIEAVRQGLQEIRERHKHFSILRSVPPEQIQELLEDRKTPVLKEGDLYQAVVTRVRGKKKETDLDIALSKKMRGIVHLDYGTSAFKVGHIISLKFDRHLEEVPLFNLDDSPTLQAAMVVLENRTGYVRALVGGSGEERFKFNRATQGRRQPGSAFKPIIYSSAIERKSYSPATVIVDEPLVVDLEKKDETEEWAPRNSGGNFLGPVSMRRALELSRNICTIKILMDVGLDPVFEMARKMGIESKLGRNLSLSLGASEVSLFEMTSAYTVFPNSGVHVEPTMVKRIEDRYGNVLEDNTEVPLLDESEIPRPTPREEFRQSGFAQGAGNVKQIFEEDLTDRTSAQDEQDSRKKAEREKLANKLKSGEGSQEGEFDRETTNAEPIRPPKPRVVRAAMSPQTAYIMTDLLRGGIRSGTGAGMAKYLTRKDIGGKTGTTNNVEDAWFIGFNPDYCAGVWVGFDEKRPMGAGEEGGRAALPVWGHFMKEILKDKTQKEFPVPPQITFMDVMTFAGAPNEGTVPKTVREPVYTPFIGRTLVLSPLDPPESLNTFRNPAGPPPPDGDRPPQRSPLTGAPVQTPGTIRPNANNALPAAQPVAPVRGPSQLPQGVPDRAGSATQQSSGDQRGTKGLSPGGPRGDTAPEPRQMRSPDKPAANRYVPAAPRPGAGTDPGRPPGHRTLDYKPSDSSKQKPAKESGRDVGKEAGRR